MLYDFVNRAVVIILQPTAQGVDQHFFGDTTHEFFSHLSTNRFLQFVRPQKLSSVGQFATWINFAFGRRHNHRLRSEIELALRENGSSFEFEPSAVGDILGIALPPSDEDEIRAYSIMKNFIYGFENASRLTPYLGAGLGWSYIDLDAPSVGIDEGIGAFSYQAIGGVARNLNNAAEFIVEYRFFGTAEVDLGGIETPITYNAHNLFLGVKFEY